MVWNRPFSHVRRPLLAFVFLVAIPIVARSQAHTPDLTSPDLWKPQNVPFSFVYGGKTSAQLLPTWRAAQENAIQGNNQIHRYTYSDPVSHLTVIADVKLYPDFPGVIDWVVRFRNDGTSDTPIIENILPLSWSTPGSEGDCILRHARGSANDVTDFTPLQDNFSPGQNHHLESSRGRSSDGDTLPFFNLQTGDHGVIGAIGWTGNWKADFTYAQDGKTVSMASGMKKTHLLLHPGEEIRTPRIVLMNWSGGNWQESQNNWRQLLFAHYTPQVNGKALRGPVLFGSWGSEPIADKLAYIQWIHDHKIPVDVYAVDAGWYGNSVGLENDPTNPEWNPWWKNRGDWYPSHRYYPDGIKPLGAALKKDGIGFSLWIEPEAAMTGTKIIREHPDWYLRRNPPASQDLWLANLGNPAALKGITDLVSNFITEFEMTWYRQDSNSPLDGFWETADTPDRIGMTEIGHIEGLYKMWDDLLALHPGLHIDNCASGGRRLDIELMSRSFVFWRTDYGFKDTLAEQAQTQALAYWVPETMGFETYGWVAANGSPFPWTTPGPYSTPNNLYLMRLGYNTGYGVNPGAAGVNNPAWVAWIKQAIGEYREVQPYFYGDFYPLLPFSRDAEAWTVWQWNRPNDKDGLVMVMRRPKSPFTSMELELQHIDPTASYVVEVRTTYDKGPVKVMTGSELAHLQTRLPDAPSSTLIFYKQK
jgi:alpha-galactosidase